MQSRRLRPVAALTLALLAAPFLAATAVAAQADGARSRVAPTARHARVTWPARSSAAVHLVAEAIGGAPARGVRQVARVATTTTAAPVATRAVAPRVTAPVPTPPSPAVADATSWIWPGDGPITSPYGRRWGRMHQGVDIDAAYGSAVVAAQRGTVIAAGWGQSGYGQVVEIDHGNGVTTLHAHLSAVAVSAGQVVAQGQQIGAVGASGSVTAAHLHYEVHVGGAPRDPMPWLTGPHRTAGNPG